MSIPLVNLLDTLISTMSTNKTIANSANLKLNPIAFNRYNMSAKIKPFGCENNSLREIFSNIF